MKVTKREKLASVKKKKEDSEGRAKRGRRGWSHGVTSRRENEGGTTTKRRWPLFKTNRELNDCRGRSAAKKKGLKKKEKKTKRPHSVNRSTIGKRSGGWGGKRATES